MLEELLRRFRKPGNRGSGQMFTDMPPGVGNRYPNGPVPGNEMERRMNMMSSSPALSNPVDLERQILMQMYKQGKLTLPDLVKFLGMGAGEQASRGRQLMNQTSNKPQWM